MSLDLKADSTELSPARVTHTNMKLRTILFPGILLFLSAIVGYSQSTFVDGVQLTTIKAPWTMRILGNDLDITGVQAKPDERSAYFMMSSGSTGLNVSVFIEPV